MPPPTPNSALKKPATRPMRTSRTRLFLQRGSDRPARRGSCAGGALLRRRRRARTDRRAAAGCASPGRDARRASPAERTLCARRLHLRPCRRRSTTDRRRSRARLRRQPRAGARRRGGRVGRTAAAVPRGGGLARDGEQGVDCISPLPRRRGRRSRALDARAREAARGTTRASSPASGARCSRCCRRSTCTREPPSDNCSASGTSGARSTPATTRPISTASERSTASTCRFGSPSCRRKARQSYVRPPT